MPRTPFSTLTTLPAFQAFQRYHDALRAQRYRITVAQFRAVGPSTVFTLDKPAHGLAPGWTPDQFATHFPRLLHWQARGFNIYYTPLHARLAYLLLDDLSYPAYASLIRQQYRPAIVIESSPHNYQAVFLVSTRTLPRAALNDWVRHMNQTYGDPHLSGAEHAHRAPGFLNQKPAYRQPDGSYPSVVLHKAAYRLCFHTAIDLRTAIASQPAPDSPTGHPSSPSSAWPLLTQAQSTETLHTQWPELPALYRQHAQDICTRYPDPDYSRVDSMIALRLRAQGYPLNAIALSILIMAPQIRPANLRTTHQWTDYAQRTAVWTFRPAATQQLARLSQHLSVHHRISFPLSDKSAPDLSGAVWS